MAKIVLKNAADLDGLRASGRVAARIRDEVAKATAPGLTTGDLADYAVQLMKEHGAESAFLNYRGFPGAICVSVNEVVVHGIPGKRRIELGDIVSLDIGVKYRGYIGDTATTMMVGVWDQEVIKLVRTAERALEVGIRSAVAGRRLSDISHAIEREAIRSGCSAVRKFVGHGIGRDMHEAPEVPNFGRPGRGVELRPGMTLCLEPMINLGGSDVDILEDNWTVVTRDRKPSAHFEHMIAIRSGTAEILSL
ncbi:MAG: type I methionyl aminopeptidase [Verrucomicrobiota bacterium]|nr:type I methionyl aminopeptidase [Verrucomicrobiota bacterium]